MDKPAMTLPPRDHLAASLFEPAKLLREARRQKGLPESRVPAVCALDPDGDVVRALEASGEARRDQGWACYHTAMTLMQAEGREVGIVPCAVGAPFAVLVAEQLFASGCQLLISVTSAGQIVPAGQPPYFVVIERALRDEGTSGHYLPPADVVAADPSLVAAGIAALAEARMPVHAGLVWTTDAPFRETEPAIAAAREAGALAVEMEAAGLYAFARARGRRVLCLAHVTNTMARDEGDFEKGEAMGAVATRAVIAALTKLL
jgi:uridine phosphorylase